MEETEAEFLHHTACDKCGSSDANAVYTDGHTHCFSCGQTKQGEGSTATMRGPKRMAPSDLLPIGEFLPIGSRKITEDTCKKWGYFQTHHKGKPCQVANYRDKDGHLVAQKVRYKDKDFSFRGEPKQALLFGQQMWKDGGRRVVVTEGEIDAMSVSQAMSHRWPVVSVKNGAQGAKKCIKAEIEWLEGYDEIVLCFDNDDAGREAANECALLFSPGKAKIAALPLKDANDMLKAGRSAELTSCLWEAKAYRPDGIVTIADIREQVLTPPEVGLPWFIEDLNKLTFGRRYGEAYALGAGTGVGKTDIITQQIEYDINTLGIPVGVFMLEQQPSETYKRIAGKMAGSRFHVPDGTWSQEDLVSTIDAMEQETKLFMYDNFGVCSWDSVSAKIRYLNKTEGVRVFYLDHLTALATGQGDNEREELERIMAELGSLVKELQIVLVFVSHLTTPEGKPHEEGGRVTVRQFKGSRSIGFWSHFMFGLERNQQADDEEERHTTVLRCLKDRLTGQSVGHTINLGYDETTGRVYQQDDGGWNFNSGASDDDPPPF